MADYQDQFKRILDEEVGEYVVKALALLKQAIQAKGLVLSEELLNSLRTQVVGATAQHVATMSRRIKDMKGLNRTKAPLL